MPLIKKKVMKFLCIQKIQYLIVHYCFYVFYFFVSIALYILSELLKQATGYKKENEIVESSNMNDMGDYRPGLQAIAELGIKSPLRYAKIYKQEIRELSKNQDFQLGINNLLLVYLADLFMKKK